MGYRATQVAGQVRQEVMEIIQHHLKDPRIGFVSITSVDMSPDFRRAHVRVSVLGDDTAQEASLRGLISAKGLIRHELGRRLQNLKFAPDLHFELDPSIEYSVHIARRLKEVLPPAPEAGRHDEEHPKPHGADAPEDGPTVEERPRSTS